MRYYRSKNRYNNKDAEAFLWLLAPALMLSILIVASMFLVVLFSGLVPVYFLGASLFFVWRASTKAQWAVPSTLALWLALFGIPYFSHGPLFRISTVTCNLAISFAQKYEIQSLSRIFYLLLPIYPFLPLAIAGIYYWISIKNDRPTGEQKTAYWLRRLALLPIRILTGAEWDGGAPGGSRKIRLGARLGYALLLGTFYLHFLGLYYTHWYRHWGDLHYLIPSLIAAGFVYSYVAKRREKPGLNASGYAVLGNNQLEHRYLAQQTLKRQLKSSEVVHHINGVKTDNRIENLCVMPREDHELFHSWLKWKREKEGHYPGLRVQKSILHRRYRGTLLES